MGAMKKSELREAVRQVIREELAELLPILMKEVLVEAYLKKLVVEQTGKRTPSLPSNSHERKRRETREAAAGLREAVFGDEEEDEDVVPSPIENDDRGIYQDEAMLASHKNESEQKVAALQSRSNPLAFIYEDIDTRQPMTAAPGSQIPGMMAPPQGPIPMPAQAGRKPNTGFDLEHMKKIIKVGESKLKKDPAQLAAEADFQAQQLKRRREMLDVPANKA